GVSWGVYTLKGRDSKNPLADTCFNFIRTLPLVFILLLVTLQGAKYTVSGSVFAILSGAIASGVGYSIWYVALRGLSATQAAVVQLTVPIIAAIGGVLFIGEAITLRLGLSATIVLSGILIVILGRYLILSQNK
ncbi:MAG: EamA family transporter, partial [Thiohalomonadales bacterium]